VFGEKCLHTPYGTMMKYGYSLRSRYIDAAIRGGWHAGMSYLKNHCFSILFLLYVLRDISSLHRIDQIFSFFKVFLPGEPKKVAGFCLQPFIGNDTVVPRAVYLICQEGRKFLSGKGAFSSSRCQSLVLFVRVPMYISVQPRDFLVRRKITAFQIGKRLFLIRIFRMVTE
jgi:hypothetical protein